MLRVMNLEYIAIDSFDLCEFSATAPGGSKKYLMLLSWMAKT